MPQQSLVLGGICIVGAVTLGGRVVRTLWGSKNPRRILASATGEENFIIYRIDGTCSFRKRETLAQRIYLITTVLCRC